VSAGNFCYPANAYRDDCSVVLNFARGIKHRLFPVKPAAAYHRLELLCPEELKRWRADGGNAKLRFNYQLSRQAVVVDLGAFDGQFASDLYAMMPCQILCFEPVPSFAAEIAQRFALNPDIRVFPYGVAAADATVSFGLAGPASSAFAQTSSSTLGELRDVAAVLAELGSPEIDLLKVNIEGGEYELMERIIAIDYLPKIKNLQIQFHRFDDASSSRREAIRRALASSHDCVYCYDFVWEDWRRKDSAA
jgi:FkbM family methyltransferase